MEQTQQESDSQRLKRTTEFEEIPQTTSLVEYAKRAARFIRTKLSFRNEVMKLVATGPDETHEFPRDQLDDIRHIDKEFREYQNDFDNIRTQGRSLQLVRNAIGAMTFLVPGNEKPHNELLRQIISAALEKTDELLPLRDEKGEAIETPFIFIPARKTLIIGGTQEVDLKQLFSNTAHIAKSLHHMKQLRSNINLYRELFSPRQQGIGPEIKAIMPYLIEALEEVIHEETEKRMEKDSQDPASKASYLREISELFQVSGHLGLTYFDLLGRGEIVSTKLPVYPRLMEDRIGKMVVQCAREEFGSHDISSLFPPPEKGSTEEDFNKAYQLILPYTKQYYFLNPKTSALVMAKMVSKRTSISQAFEAYRPEGILALSNPSLGNLGVLEPFLEYLYPKEKPFLSNVMLLKPFHLSRYYHAATPAREVDQVQYENEVNIEDITYLFTALRRAFASSSNITEAMEKILPGVNIKSILREDSSSPDSIIGYRFRLLLKHASSVFCGFEVQEKFMNLVLGNLYKKTLKEWDERVFRVAKSFAEMIPESDEEKSFADDYEAKQHRLLNYACGEVLFQDDQRPLNQLSNAYNAYFLNQFVFRGHVLEHLVKRDPRILASKMQFDIDIEDHLPYVYDQNDGIRVLSYFENSLQMFSWQKADLILA